MPNDQDITGAVERLTAYVNGSNSYVIQADLRTILSAIAALQGGGGGDQGSSVAESAARAPTGLMGSSAPRPLEALIYEVLAETEGFGDKQRAQILARHSLAFCGREGAGVANIADLIEEGVWARVEEHEGVRCIILTGVTETAEAIFALSHATPSLPAGSLQACLAAKACQNLSRCSGNPCIHSPHAAPSSHAEPSGKGGAS